MSTLIVRRSWRLAAFLLALSAAGVGACVAPVPDRSGFWVPVPGKETVFFDAEVFAGTTPRRAVFIDRWEWQREEYARFEGGGARAELVYITTTHPNIALEYRFKVRDTVETWNMTRRDSPQWGSVREVPTELTQFFAQPFTLPAADRLCVGFNAEWDGVGDDPQNRVGKVLFGYYCAPSGTELTEERIAPLLDRVGLRGITEPLYRHAEDPAPQVSMAQAETIARGASPTADTGNAGFPFGFGRYFNVGNGHRNN